MTNPALELREALRARYPGAMVRWDDSGRALLVTDAPRRGCDVQDAPAANGLAYYDLPPAALTVPSAPPFAGYTDDFPELQAALAMLLPDGFSAQKCAAELSPQGRRLVQTALAACARGERQVRALLPNLRAAWAAALREKNAAQKTACRATAAVLAAWDAERRERSRAET